MKILNKFIWSKKEPSNKNDIWFDGSTWRMYTEEAWQSFTLPVDAADKVAKVLENASEVYQEKLNDGYGIIIDGNTISLDKYLIDIELNKKQDELKSGENIKTINGQSLLGNGDIEIKGGSSTYVTDFTVADLSGVINGNPKQCNLARLKQALENKEIILVPYGPEELKGYSLLQGYSEDLLYFSVTDERGNIYSVETNTNAREIYSENITFISPRINQVDIADLQVKNAQTDVKLTELSEEIESNGQLIEDLQNMKIDKEADDYYPQLAVGLADNLSGVDVVDSEVNFRRSGGGAISDGVARIEAIKGNSVVWNQLYPTGWNTTREGITITSQNNIITANGTLTAAYFSNKLFEGNEVNHKYLFIVEGLSSAFNGAKLELLNRGVNAKATISNGFSYIFYVNSDPSQGRNIGFSGLTSGTVISETYIFRQIDLTKMFGAGNEPTTIEEFYARIPMGVDLNAYNEGEVIHMDVQSIESQGVNAWDEEWEIGGIELNGELNNDKTRIRTKNPIRIFAQSKYYVETGGKTLGIRYYDKEGNHLGQSSNINTIGSSITTPANAYYMRFSVVGTTTYNHDICINLSDTSINGQYFPYIKRVEDLAVIRKYFPDGMKSAPTAHDAIRYNKESGKWEKVVRIGEVDMGTLDYIYQPPIEGTYPHGYYQTIVEGKAFGNSNMLCGRYSTAVNWTSVGIRGSESSNKVYVKDSAYTSAASFKAAMAGVMLYYELAEPIVTELDAEDQFKDLDYQVWNCGTEKAIAEGKSAPLAADITYGFNAIGKIKELENLVAALRAKVGI